MQRLFNEHQILANCIFFYFVFILGMVPVGNICHENLRKHIQFLDLVFVCLNRAVSLSIGQMFDGIKKILGQMFRDRKWGFTSCIHFHLFTTRPQSAQIRCTWMSACKADDCFPSIHSWKSRGKLHDVCVHLRESGRYFENATAFYWRKGLFSNGSVNSESAMNSESASLSAILTLW